MGNEKLYTFSNTLSWGKRKKEEELKRIFHNLVPHLPVNATVLEAGSGRGEFAEIVRQEGFGYVGIEPSVTLRAGLESRGIRVLADALPEIRLDKAMVDLVYSYDVVEHLGDYSTVLGFFQEAYRVLKDGGYMVVIAPNAETIGNLFYLYEYQHSFLTTLSRIETLLGDAGFKVIGSRAFLTSLGLSKFRAIRIVDRLVAHMLLIFARSITITGVMRVILGRSIVFRIHKTLYDHIAVVAQKDH